MEQDPQGPQSLQLPSITGAAVVVVVVVVVVVLVVVVVVLVDVVVVLIPNVTGSGGQQTSGKKPEKLQTDARRYLMASDAMGFLRRTSMLLHLLSPIHSPSFPSGVVHLFTSFSGGGPPKEICDETRGERRKIIKRLRLVMVTDYLDVTGDETKHCQLGFPALRNPKLLD